MLQMVFGLFIYLIHPVCVYLPSNRAPPPHSVRGQGIYPAPRSLPESGEDTLVQAILNLDRGYVWNHAHLFQEYRWSSRGWLKICHLHNQPVWTFIL